jgi:Tol biopolymer transport system component
MPADTLVRNFFPNAVFGDQVLLARNEPSGEVSGWSMSLKTGEIKKILDDEAFYMRYVDAGYLVVQSGVSGRLSAYPYSEADHEITGLAQPFSTETNYNDWFVTRSGYLVTMMNSGAASLEMLMLDEDGKAQRLLDPVLNYEEFQFSPSGRFLIAEINGYENGQDQLLLFDLQTGLSRQVTYSDAFFEPTLSPAGDRVAFASPRNGVQDIGIRNVDGTGDTEWITASAFLSGDPDWAPSGDFIVFDRSTEVSDFDIWMYAFEKKEASPLVEDPGSQMYPRVSHSSRYVAYQSNQTRTTEAWVMDLQTGVKTRVSPSGGFRPAWGPDDSVLYYSTGAQLMAVDVATSNGFSVTGQPRPVFDVGSGFYFDVSDQGRIAIAKQVGNPALSLEIIQNWPATLE